MAPSHYHGYLAHAATLRPRARLSRIPLVTIAAVLGNVAATVGLFMGTALLIAAATGQTSQAVLVDLSNLRTPLALVAFLVSFAGASLAIMLALPLVHGLRLGQLNSAGGAFQWGNFARAAGLVLGIGVAATILALPFQQVVRNAGWGLWLQWLAPALAGILVQVHAEELFFRGYLQSLLAARFRHPAVWIGVPSAIFSAIHLPNAAAFGDNAWLAMMAPLLVGLAAADVTARTGGIGAAVGLHFANNALGILLVGVPGPFGQIALYQHPIDLADAASVRPMILLNLGVILLAYVIYRWLEARLHRPRQVSK